MDIGDKVLCPTKSEVGEGTIIGLHDIFGEKYAEIFFESTKEKLRLPISEITERLTPVEKMQVSKFSSAQQFKLDLLKNHIHSLISRQEVHTAANFKIQPLPHQILAVDFVLGKYLHRALIADEVGLGKTIEAALIYEELKNRNMAKRILIIAPSGLCNQWQEEMEFKFGEQFAIYDRDMVHSLKKSHGHDTNIWTCYDQIITSLDFIKPKKLDSDISERARERRKWHNENVTEAASEAGFDVVIFDEAHKLTKDMSGDETARYKVGNNMANSVPILLLLSATPHQGKSSRFRNLLNLIDPYLFYKGCEITPEIVKKVTVRNNKRAAVDFEGNRLFKQRLTSLYMIKRDEEKDKLELDLYNAVTEYISQYYDMAERDQNRTLMFLLLIYQRMVSSSSQAILNALANRMNALLATKEQLEQPEDDNSEIGDEEIYDLFTEDQLQSLEIKEAKRQKLRKIDDIETEINRLQKCISLAKRASTGRNDLKFRKLLEIINDFIMQENRPNLKFIIFTEFLETQTYIQDSLESLGYSTVLINGQMSPEDKIRQKKKFQEDVQFLISTDAGGEGINLQFCWVMINYDMPWNPMRLEQRIGRIDRIGQKHDVKIVNFQLADTVEQRVREIIEGKLETVKEEFNDGEDKLADILSTLQDEFNFEKIYIDAVRKRKSDEDKLGEIAEGIYSRAKQIIETGDYSLPFSEMDPTSVSEYKFKKQNEIVKQFLDTFLKANGASLIQYKTKSDVYYFKDPHSSSTFKNVIFDQEQAVENEDYELFSLSHPYIKNLLQSLNKGPNEDNTAKIHVHENKFSGKKGFLFMYSINITNNIDETKTYNLPIFIDYENRYNSRISRYFEDIPSVDLSELIVGKIPFSFEQALAVAENVKENKAQTVFQEYKVEQSSKIEEIEENMIKYFKEKENSINKIAVENIRNGKLKELQVDRENKYTELQNKKILVPSLDLKQISYVEFG